MCQSEHWLIRSARSIKTFYKCKCLCIMYTRQKQIFKVSLILPLFLLSAAHPLLLNVLELKKGRKWFGLIINNDIHQSCAKRWRMRKPVLAYFRPQQFPLGWWCYLGYLVWIKATLDSPGFLVFSPDLNTAVSYCLFFLLINVSCQNDLGACITFLRINLVFPNQLKVWLTCIINALIMGISLNTTYSR